MKTVCGMKFLKQTITGMDGQPVTMFCEDSGDVDPFKVRVTREGMKFEGRMSKFISTEDEVQEWAKFMGDWVIEVRRLRPRLVMTPAGH